MANLYLIRGLCNTRGISLKELSKRSQISEMGLQRILKTNSIKIDVLERISKALKVSPNVFFDKDESETNVSNIILTTLDNDLLTMLCNRLKSYHEKIYTLQDYYIWEHVRYLKEIGIKYNENTLLAFPVKYKGCPGTLVSIEQAMQIQMIITDSFLLTPYSKWPSTKQGLIKTTNMIEGFYFILFSDNIFQITNLLTDNLITDHEINKYWGKWKSIEVID